MVCSEARVAANRANARKSSGPRTAEGKQRSRANALKHGLSGGAGVVLSVGDGAAVDAIEAELAAELNPGTVIGEGLVRRTAVLLVRLRRCAEHDHAATAHRVRHAVADFEDQRAAEVATLADQIAINPADAVRRLRRTPEGVDHLIGGWRAIRREVADPRGSDPSAVSLADRVGALLGRTPGDDREPGDLELDAWCRDLDAAPGTRERVLARVDAEVAALRALRPEVAAVAAADRAEAPARALFDEAPAGQRARRYEAATERGLFRVLRELRESRSGTPFALPASPPASRVAPEPAPPPPPVRPTPSPATTAPPVPPPAPAKPDPMRNPAALVIAWPTWPDLPVEDTIDVPLSIGRPAIPGQTNPPARAQTNPFAAQTNPRTRRPRLR